MDLNKTVHSSMEVGGVDKCPPLTEELWPADGFWGRESEFYGCDPW